MPDSPPLPKNLVINPVLSQWIGFERDGQVRLSPGKVEIGQGIAAALAQIAADELDVDLTRIRVMTTDTATSPNEEVTSGSLSVQDSGLAVRHAAAEIRSIFLDAAAKQLGLHSSDLSMIDGSIVGPENARTSYWELADSVSLERAATMGVRPKASAARQIAGRPLQRPEIAERVFGRRPYLHDLRPADLKHGRVVRPASVGASLAALDEARFRTHYPDVLLVRNGAFLGVVAEHEHQAEGAATLLARCAQWQGGNDIPAPSHISKWLADQPADTATVLETSAACATEGKRLSRSYTKPFIAHASIGPSVALAEWKDGQLIITSHSQGIFNLRRDLALVFGLEDDKVRVIHAEGAGCYGHNGADDVALDAALLARAANAPVRVQWSRADELSQAPFGAAMRMDLEALLGDDGKIMHWSHTLTSNGHVARPGRAATPALLAAFSLDPPYPRYVAGDPPLASGGGAQRNSVPLYAFPHQRIEQRRVLTAPLRTSSLRSLGAYGNVFAIESFMDELAEATGQDALAFRLAHLSDERAITVLQKAAAMAKWGTSCSEGRGRGIALARYKNTGAYCAVVAEIDIEKEPRASELWIAVDVGEAINPDGVINQIEGGAIQSVSWTLKEEVGSGLDGVLPRSWEHYPILRFSEVPAVSVEIIPQPDQPPLGAGECAHGPVAAALANAVHAALGVRIRHLPITREKIINALETA